eukprot:CAMPEP_0118924278 /NCGR_PEP_ID=MMETSP1169-20130426/2488_1 /TAXON_ID=36882 /ORGANISM="Pyramimonas obovata, Strain CCMP722" /LENGTH=412 /DNA_ID=CAMNT_0006865375 /DNA_START=115 /DNA_END=1353 /DNA_ORIENTATION=+
MSMLHKFGWSSATRLASLQIRRNNQFRINRNCSLAVAPNIRHRKISPRGTQCSSRFATDSVGVLTFFEDYVIRSYRPEDKQEVNAILRAEPLERDEGSSVDRDAHDDDNRVDGQECAPAFLVIAESQGKDGNTPKIVGYTAYHGSANGGKTVNTKDEASAIEPGRKYHTYVHGSVEGETAEALSTFATSVAEWQTGIARDSHSYLGKKATQEFSQCRPPPGSVQNVVGEARANVEKGSRELLKVISINGHVLGVYPRAYVEKHNLLHRAVGVFVQNEAGEIYVHRRAPTKSVHPNMYDMFVGGLVVAGETVEQAARNEALEELGIRVHPEISHINPMFTHEFMGPRNRVIVSCYRVVMHKPETIRHDDGEVVWGQWMSVEDLKEMIEDKQFVPGGLAMWKETVRKEVIFQQQ